MEREIAGYVLYDGDYSSENAHLLEKLLTEKLGQKYNNVDECALNNADSITEDKAIKLLIDYGGDDEGWDDDDVIDLTDNEVEIVCKAIPEPGNGPYFCWNALLNT